MFSNYIKIAWRNLWKHKVFAVIVIFGMAIAFAASLLLSLQLTMSCRTINFMSTKRTCTSSIFTNNMPKEMRPVPPCRYLWPRH